MDPYEPPRVPVKPALPAKPRGSWISIALVGFMALALAAVLTFLTLGYFGPIVVMAFGIFAVIGLQYIIWGWWFERIYRSNIVQAPGEQEAAPPE